jgi:hypothetical protein
MTSDSSKIIGGLQFSKQQATSLISNLTAMNTIIRKLFVASLPFLALVALFRCEDETKPGSFAKPEIISVSIEKGLVGDEVTITGKGLKKVTRVEFADVPADDFNSDANTDNEIKVKVPDGLKAGQVLLTVYYAGKSETNLGASDDIMFVVLYPPVISLVTPAEAKPTKIITINGEYLDIVEVVKFGEISVPFEEENGVLTVVVPDIAAGEVDLSVTSEGGVTSTTFTVIAKIPEITSFTPVEAKATNEITVNGLFFTGTTAVKVGDVAGTNITVVSDTQLKFKIGVGSASGKISVTTPLGTGTSTDNISVIQTLPLPYSIYGGAIAADGLNSNWQKWDGWGTASQTLESTEQAKTGTKAIKIVWAADNAWGGFQLHPVDPSPFVLETVTKVKMSFYGGAGSNGSKIAIYIKAVGAGDPPDSQKKEFTLVEGSWINVEATLSELGNPASINELVFQNRGTAGITVYVDDLQLN